METFVKDYGCGGARVHGGKYFDGQCEEGAQKKECKYEGFSGAVWRRGAGQERLRGCEVVFNQKDERQDFRADLPKAPGGDHVRLKQNGRQTDELVVHL